MELKTSLEVTKDLQEKIEEAELGLQKTKKLKTKGKYKLIEYYRGYIHGLKTAKNLVVDNSKLE